MKRPKALWDVGAVLLSLVFCYSYISYGFGALLLIPAIFLLLNKSRGFSVFRAVQPMLILPLVFVEGNLLFGIAVLVVGVLSSSLVSLLRNLGKKNIGDFVNLNLVLISACLVSGIFSGLILEFFEVVYIVFCLGWPFLSFRKNIKRLPNPVIIMRQLSESDSRVF